MRPIQIPKAVRKYIESSLSKAEMCKQVAANYKALYKGEAEISVVMPAYNETNCIVPTLASLCQNKTSRNIEIIVVNNNSSDDTGELARACGINVIDEYRQGIVFARNAGMLAASGKYIVNADADTIYPEDWIELMVKPLIEDENIAITYGRFSLIPVGTTGRLTYFFYEHISALSRWYNKQIKDEAVNVYGFNSAFRKAQGLQVDGFNKPDTANEDGWLAVKLRQKGFGKLFYVNHIKALVWTTDRRIQMDGGLLKGIIKRVKRVLNIG